MLTRNLLRSRPAPLLIGLLVATLLMATVAGCALPVDLLTLPEARIQSFTLTTADHPLLAEDVIGIINPSTRVITLKVDLLVITDRSELVPTIALDDGATVFPPSGEANDFTQTPVTYKLTDQSGRTAVYYVQLVQKPVDAPEGAIRITEYFCGTGTGTATTGELNRYIEFYNGSDVGVDLAQFELVQKRSRAGVPDPALDQMATLKGTIAAHSFFIVHSARMNTTLLTTVYGYAARQSDSIFNGIMDGDGASAYQLQKNGQVLDVVGPNDGSLYATNMCLFRRSDTNSGLPRAANPVWAAADWVNAPVSGILGDDTNAGLASRTDPTLLSLTVSAGTIKAMATIDAGAKTATVLLPDGVDKSALVLAVGTFGTALAIDGQAIVNNQTVVDFSAGSRTLTITGQDGMELEYTVDAIPRYTNVNYDFDGGIQAMVDKIWLGGSNESTLSSVGDGTVTGIVTAKGIYPNAFFIQDRNAGLYFYTSEGISFPVGAKIKITVTTGKVYYGMPEVTAFDPEIQSLSSGLSSIYYRTGDYANEAAIGQVFRYTGSIAQGGLMYYKGQFSGALYFHYPTEIQSYLGAGASGTFYGPVSYTRENYTMELVTREQFSLDD